MLSATTQTPTLKNLLHLATQKNASDIHINNKVIFFRINKQVVRVSTLDSTPDSSLDSSPDSLLNSFSVSSIYAELQSLDSTNEKSVSLVIGGVKCRVSSFLADAKLCFAIRILRSEIPSLESLKVPKILETLSLKPSGLVLVCGATGEGKSTTIAAMINHINRNARKHILTIENPVEYEHKSIISLVSQREIGSDSSNYQAALESSLRQDPDVIVIGEILESSTLKLAINHALSGHLVISSFHAHDCTHAVSRILGLLSTTNSGDINANANLADCLEGIITQRLVDSNNGLDGGGFDGGSFSGGGLKADFEILIATPAVRILIKENKLNQLDSQISMGREFGMRRFAR